MLIEAKNFLDLPVATIEEKEKIGLVKKILIDKKNAKILGFIINTGGFLFGNDLFLSETDLLDIDTHGLTTRNKDNLVDPSEIVRVKKMLDEQFSLFRLTAMTRSKRKLGKISNFVIDTTMLQVVKFYVTGWIDNKIIDYRHVYKITNKEIIFDDLSEKQTPEEKIKKLATD